MNKKAIIIRICADIALFFLIINGWWFLALPLSLICLWSFSYYIEAIVAGIAFDSLFGYMPGMGLIGYSGTVLAVAITIVVYFLKRMMR